MPELPEVETVARVLHPLAAGRVARRVEVLDAKLNVSTEALGRLTGAAIRRVFRWGKQVAFETEPADGGAAAFLLVHLRMTGRLLFRALGEPAPPGKARAVLTLDGGDEIRFHDARRFGTWTLTDNLDVARGWLVDPLDDAFTAQRLGELIGACPTAIKPWLLRQDRLVGVGNIYASEILFRAGLHPAQPAASLNEAERVRLHRAIRRVLREAIRHCGTTIADFQDGRGVEGDYGRFLSVYGRAGEPCRVCGAPIVRFVQAQRGTYCCPGCQPAPAYRKGRGGGRSR